MSVLITPPQLLIEVDGVTLAADEIQGLVQVRVQQRLSAPTLCELYFHAAVGSLQAMETLVPGTSLRVRIVNQATPLFAGQITALEYIYGPVGQQELCIRGYDMLHALRQRQSVQVHLDVTVADLARELADCSVQAAENGPRWSMLFQHRQNDLELLAETAAYSGLYLTMREQTLHLLTLAGEGALESLTLGESLLEARFELNADAVANSVSTVGWNPLDVAAYDGRAGRARTNQQTGATTNAQQIGGSRTTALVDEATPTREHAAALAQAELDQRQAKALSFWGVAIGNPALRPGIPIQIHGVADQLTGRYVLTEVTHIIDGEMGFVTELSTSPPPIRRRARSSVATLGIVTQVDDDEKLGRIRVRLPTFQDVETGWLGVLLPAAGPGKGFIALPDVGDTVLVLLTHENPGQGIVLGGLYGMQRPPDSGVRGNAVRRYTWVTPGGQQIQLDDDQKTIRFENSSGSYIELNRNDVIIAGQAIDLRRS